MPKYNLHQADFDKTRQLLQDIIFGMTFLNCLDINSAWQLLQTNLQTYIASYI